jgi:excisionase family DNA binding protein
VSERTLRRWVAEHRVTFERVGTCVRFKREALDRIKPARKRIRPASTSTRPS